MQGGEHLVERVVLGLDATDVAHPDEQQLVADLDHSESRCEAGLETVAVRGDQPLGLAAQGAVEARSVVAVTTVAGKPSMVVSTTSSKAAP